MPNNTLIECQVHNLFNSNCNSCQKFAKKMSNLNYFELYGFKTQFNIDKNLIRKKYYAFQSIFHPDNFSNESSQIQDLMLKNSSIINESFEVLKEDFLRATYLVKIFIGEKQLNVTLDLQFIEYIMSLHEKALLNDSNDLKQKMIEDTLDLENSLWAEFESNTESKQWHEANITLAKIKMIQKLSIF